MFANYIIRMDDASPTMSLKKWNRLEKLLDKYQIKPIVAVIPNNKDPQLLQNYPNNQFWKQVKVWQDKKWAIALHGFEHKYTTEGKSLVPINNYSEFTGLSLEEQKLKIKSGIKIFNKNFINCNLWVAPAHSFDENTIKALKSETNIHIISDGIGWSPYYEYGMYWIPQQLWKPRTMLFGTWTICYHPDDMSNNDFEILEDFFKKNRKNIISVEELKLSKKPKSLLEKLFEKLYWRLLRRKQKE